MMELGEMTIRDRLAAALLTALLVSATPAPTIILHPDIKGEALIVPANSPVKFSHFDKYGVAHFKGRFVLNGTFFIEGCESDCPGFAQEDLGIDVFPDPKLEASLPHWKVHNNDILMTIRPEGRLMGVVTGSRQRAALVSGKSSDIRGSIAIVVDDFQTSLECDSANFSARFIALAKAPKIAQVEFKGNYGCG
jgi:hypothetical protein